MTVTEVRLVEGQVAACAPPGSLGLQERLWRAVTGALASADSSGGSRSGRLGSAAASNEALAAAFLPAALAPSHLSRPALASALDALGCGVSRESVLQVGLCTQS